jgi:hypothetical protein
VPFVLASEGPIPGHRRVYCKYRNASGAESYTYSATILYDPRGDFDGDRTINAQDPDDDDDGLSDADEVGKYCTDPFDRDSDDDGIEDGAEIKAGTNPRSSDTDGDGLKDPVDPDPTHPSGGIQRPGDCNRDGSLDIADGICVLVNLFLGIPDRLPCGNGTPTSPANLRLLDVSGGGQMDLSDGIYIFNYLFTGGPPPDQGIRCIRIEDCPVGCQP